MPDSDKMMNQFDEMWNLSNGVVDTMNKCAVEMEDDIDHADVMFAFFLGAVKFSARHGLILPDIDKLKRSLLSDD